MVIYINRAFHKQRGLRHKAWPLALVWLCCMGYVRMAEIYSACLAGSQYLFVA
jgi:hypothetical protein